MNTLFKMVTLLTSIFVQTIAISKNFVQSDISTSVISFNYVAKTLQVRMLN